MENRTCQDFRNKFKFYIYLALPTSFEMIAGKEARLLQFLVLYLYEGLQDSTCKCKVNRKCKEVAAVTILALALDNCLASKLSGFHAANNGQVCSTCHSMCKGFAWRSIEQQKLSEGGVTKYEMGQFGIHMILLLWIMFGRWSL